jgi:hypothetical protein
MRLIEDGFLDEASVAELAERLGIGPRHLLRLFLRHTGATPREIATTRRVQTAQRLIDQTPMPLSEIAFAAGFAACDGSTMRSARLIGVHRLAFGEPQLPCIEPAPDPEETAASTMAGAEELRTRRESGTMRRQISDRRASGVDSQCRATDVNGAKRRNG